MRVPTIIAALLVAVPVSAAPRVATIAGEYVEARTAEVFTGGCVMSSEAETIGRQAVLAWRIDRGTHDGVALDGLSVVAAVAGDHNLGIRELGGSAPQLVRAALVVDARATEAQRAALVAFVRNAVGGLIDEVVDVQAAPISFVSDEHRVDVAAGDATLAVQKHLHHDPNCGAMQWFRPLARVEQADMGMTDAHAFSGRSLGIRWSHPNRKSAFVGTFAY